MTVGDVGGKPCPPWSAPRPCNCVWLLSAVTVRIVRVGAAVHASGVGACWSEFIALYLLGVGGVPPDAAQPGAVRPHPAGQRRRFHRSAVAVAAGHRCGPDLPLGAMASDGVTFAARRSHAHWALKIFIWGRVRTRRFSARSYSEPAGTFDYWRAWVFLAAFVGTTIGPTIYLARSPQHVACAASVRSRRAERFRSSSSSALFWGSSR